MGFLGSFVGLAPAAGQMQNTCHPSQLCRVPSGALVQDANVGSPEEPEERRRSQPFHHRGKSRMRQPCLGSYQSSRRATWRYASVNALLGIQVLSMRREQTGRHFLDARPVQMLDEIAQLVARHATDIIPLAEDFDDDALGAGGRRPLEQ